jgi:DNA-binding SARP family transcriptional activator/DNA-binding beta-propeller fold protein YncE
MCRGGARRGGGICGRLWTEILDELDPGCSFRLRTIRDAAILASVRKRGLETPQKRSKRPTGLEFRVLGPLEVRAGGTPLPLGGPKQRALLALLLLHANEAVSRDRLIDGVWGESPPSTIGAVLNVYLSKLRKLLAANGLDNALVTQPHGYMLRLELEQLDLHRFEELVREGRDALAAQDTEQGVARLQEALALWRGPPLADLAYAPFAAPKIGRLVELRLSALEDRIEAQLALGRHFEVVPELTALVAEYPLCERLRFQLMMALYRTGRQSEALQVYRESRRLLAEEQGIDPGPELQRLEKAILVHDPSLAPPGSSDADPSATDGRARRPVAAAAKAALTRRRAVTRRSPIIVVLAGLVAAAVAVPILALIRGEGDRPRREQDQAGLMFANGSEVAVVSPDTNKVVARVPVGSEPTLVREGDGSVWVADRRDQTVTQIDPESTRVVSTMRIGFRPDDLAARDGAVWAVNREEGVLGKLAYGEISDRFERRGFVGFGRMAVDDKAVWLGSGKSLIRVDPATGRVLNRADVPVELDGVAVGEGAVWVVSGLAASVLRINRDTGAVTDQIPIATRPDVPSPYPMGVAADADFVWVLNGSTATVTKIDPELGDIVATFPLGTGPGSLKLAAGEGAAWICNEQDGTLTRIDAETDAMTSIPVAPDDRPTDVAVAGGLVWVTVDEW